MQKVKKTITPKHQFLYALCSALQRNRSATAFAHVQEALEATEDQEALE